MQQSASRKIPLSGAMSYRRTNDRQILDLVADSFWRPKSHSLGLPLVAAVVEGSMQAQANCSMRGFTTSMLHLLPQESLRP